MSSSCTISIIQLEQLEFESLEEIERSVMLTLALLG